MNNKITRVVALFALWAAAVSHAGVVDAADSYPTKTIRIVVPYAAGGDTDLITRQLAQTLTEAFGKQVVVDNRAGANGIIGTEFVANAAPDGYTLLMGANATHAINPTLYRRLRYDPIKDFEAISGVANIPMLLVVNPATGVKSFDELMALAKAKPGRLNYASAGSGSPQHLAGEMLKMVADIDINHIPYKGGGPAAVDVVAGQVEMMFAFTTSALTYINSGRLRPLVTTTKERLPQTPLVPSVAEVGMPRLELSGWMGMFAPAGTPAAVVNRLNAEIVKAMDTPALKEALRAMSGQALTSSPEQFAAFVKAEGEKWGKVIKASGATVD